jgi:predicted nucleic acid-binding Zn ribbon protein
MYVKKFRPIDSYLNLAALLPFEEDLPTLDRASPDLVQRVATLWIETAARQPELGLPVTWSSEGDAEHRYEIFHKVRQILRTVIEIVTDPKVDRPKGRYTSVLDERMMSLKLPPTERSLMLTSGGVIVATSGVGIFVNVLEQLGAEVWSLRACPVCGAPFLRHRSDQKACSLKCANVRHVRRSRARDAEKGASNHE